MTLRVLVAGVVTAGWAALAVPVLTQTPQQPVFKSGVDLVRLDVRVTDANGRPITDLRQDEIEIVEDGRRLPLVLFQRVSEPADSYVDDALKAVTAEVSSNEAFPRGHLYILIFDQQHITAGNEMRARQAAEQFIRTRVRPSDRIALFAIPGPGPQIGFTTDKLRVSQALEQIRGSYQASSPTPFGTIGLYEAHRIVQGDEVLLTKTIERLTAEGGGDVLGVAETPPGRGGGAGAAGGEDAAAIKRLVRENARSVVNQSDAESRQQLQRLADVIEQFREVEGRKTVVYFSEGFFQDNLSRELEDVAAAAAQSYAVFYAFDLNRRNDNLTAVAPSNTVQASEIQARMAPLATLASETDGMLIVDAAARTEEALNRIADQAREYYLVGFTPSEQALTRRGAYRRMTVRTTRPGARVSTRSGYAVADAAPPDKRKAITNVLQMPFVQQGLQVDYTTYVMKGSAPGEHRVVLSLNTALPVRAQTTDVADVLFVARDVRDGRVVASGGATIPLPAAAADGSTLGTGSWRVQFTVPPGIYAMRAAVREPGGLSGSADRQIEVKPLTGPDVTVSDLVLGSPAGGLAVRPRAYTEDGLSGVLETYGRTATQLEELQVAIELQDAGGTRATMMSATLHPAEEDATGLRRRASFLLPLAGVAPGAYSVKAIVRARGEIMAERVRSLEVLPGAGPAVAPATAAPLNVSAVDILNGDLGRRYISSIVARAESGVARTAAGHASASRWEQTELELQRATGDETFAAHALRGLARFAREDYAGAAASLQLAQNLDPKNALTAFFLGWAREGAGDAPGAISAWRAAAHLDPSMVSAHLALADAYLRLSNPPLAIQALKAGLAAIPASPELQSRLAQLERRQ